MLLRRCHHGPLGTLPRACVVRHPKDARCRARRSVPDASVPTVDNEGSVAPCWVAVCSRSGLHRGLWLCATHADLLVCCAPARAGAVGGVGGAGGGAGGLDGGEEEGYFDPDELALLDQVAEVIQLVVWDFDLTVLSIHSFGMRIRASDITDGVRPEEVIRGDFTDLPFFRALTAALLERGVKVAIASFGVYATIQAYCDFAFPKDNPFSVSFSFRRV